MITLGCFDSNLNESACRAYRGELERTTRLALAEVVPGVDKIALHSYVPSGAAPMSVAQAQEALRSTGFFPGGKIDGICGYRTTSAIRLFQEYVRSVEKLDCMPDGVLGPKSQQHLRRWVDKHLTPNWARPGTEYAEWAALLNQVKARYAGNPPRVLQMVNAFSKPTDTRKVAQWDYSPNDHVHLVGIRRTRFSGKFDDIFVLLVKGLVFKFQGSTEPGASSNPLGAPFLVQGQHDYHFGWHKRTYLALRPQGPGVLVVRSGSDMRLDESDLARGLEANATINIHWGGKGMTADVKTWSEGCQVINGSVYFNAADELVDCSPFAATNQAELASNPQKTRGAYNVLVDLVTALASDRASNSVKYTLLTEGDLDLAPGIRDKVADAVARVVRKVK